MIRLCIWFVCGFVWGAIIAARWYNWRGGISRREREALRKLGEGKR